MISKNFTILVFSLIFLMAVMASGQQIERDSKEAHFEVGKDDYINEWLILGPFPDDWETDFLESAGGEANIRPYEGMTVTAPDGKTYTWKRSKGTGFLNTMRQFLFRLEMGFQKELEEANNPYPSAGLRGAFEKIKSPFLKIPVFHSP